MAIPLLSDSPVVSMSKHVHMGLKILEISDL
jgi:hypothetical protein